MAGIYVHIPYCRTKCLYCNFYSIPSSESIGDYVSAVIAELGMRRDYLNGEKIDTIYFGGGTPSIAGTDSIRDILRAVHDSFDVAADSEITLEANPDDTDPGFLSRLKDAGINRLSIGIQSFRDEDLRYLGRAHNAASAVSAIERSLAAGFSNLTIDLIYGIPGLDDDAWKRNIDIAADYGIPHISAYALTVECDTPIERLIEKGKREAPSEEDGARQFEILMNEMRRRGYIHYEISNFCREGYVSRHNSSYWRGIPYLGAGASAHSYDGRSRQWNTADVVAYIDGIGKGTIPSERETLTRERLYNEYVMTSLRTMWGMSLRRTESIIGKNHIEQCRSVLERYISSGQLIMENDMIFLSDRGKLIADRIIADLFYA